MRYAFFDANGRVTESHHDLTLTAEALPEGAVPLTEYQWGRRFDLRLQGGILIEDPPAVPLEQIRAARWEAIKKERDRRIQCGGYKVGARWYHSDTFSRTQQLGLFQLGASLPAGVQWKTMDGTFVTMTQALAGQIFTAAVASDIAVFAAAEAHKAALEAAADPVAYDFSGGWPATFGE